MFIDTLIQALYQGFEKGGSSGNNQPGISGTIYGGFVRRLYVEDSMYRPKFLNLNIRYLPALYDHRTHILTYGWTQKADVKPNIN